MVAYTAALAIFLLICLAIFQILLAAGKPYGEYAWGGKHDILPQRLRIASAVSVLLYAFFAFVIADAVHWISIIPNNSGIVALSIYFTAGIMLNAISRSKKERLVMTPIVVVLAICCWILVLGY